MESRAVLPKPYPGGSDSQRLPGLPRPACRLPPLAGGDAIHPLKSLVKSIGGVPAHHEWYFIDAYRRFEQLFRLFKPDLFDEIAYTFPRQVLDSRIDSLFRH